MGSSRVARQPAPSAERKPVQQIILLIHGIRTRAEWQEMVRNVLEQEGVSKVIPLRYGRFDAFRFWWPLWTRERPIEKILWRIEDAIHSHPGAQLMIIAHSFGTYAVTTILRRKPHIRPARMILCGSIVPEEFRWDQLPNRPEVINECGSRDIWPILAKATSWGYGASGTF